MVFSVFQDKRAAWFNLFADLDPLADPDAVGRTVPGAEDRNCWVLVHLCQATIIQEYSRCYFFRSCYVFGRGRFEYCTINCAGKCMCSISGILCIPFSVKIVYIYLFKPTLKSSLRWNSNLYLYFELVLSWGLFSWNLFVAFLAGISSFRHLHECYAWYVSIQPGWRLLEQPSCIPELLWHDFICFAPSEFRQTVDEDIKATAVQWFQYQSRPLFRAKPSSSMWTGWLLHCRGESS